MTGSVQQPVQSTWTPVGVYNGPIPREGPKTLPVTLQFTMAVQSILVDLTTVMQRGAISAVQAVYIDNSLSSSTTTMVVGGSNQKVIAAAFSQGFYPVIATNPANFTFTNTAQVNVPIQFLNVPITCITWNTQSGQFQFTAQGYLETADVVLDATVSNGRVNVLPAFTGNNDTPISPFSGTKYFPVSCNTTAQTTLIAGNPGFFFTSIIIKILPTSTFTGGGAGVIFIEDNGVPIIGADFWLPSSFTGGTVPIGNQIIFSQSGFTYIGTTSGGKLTCTSSINFTSGAATIQVVGGTTATLAP